ncbi:MAG: choline kinase [Clostridia bacterium]|nr:choline kinase [Clostridia bacterium]
MEQTNLSVFGAVLRNDEIAGFFRMVNLVREIFSQELTVLEIMPGGLTNKNFRAVLEDGRQLAVRLAGKGTANYINRPGEKHNATEIASLGIAPEIFYYDPETGSQIVEYIDAPTMHPEDFQTRDEVLVKAGEVMRRYHDSGKEFKTSFDPISKIDEYKVIMAEHKYEKRYEGWDRIIENLAEISKAYTANPPRRVPCHNDTLAENFMLQGEKMRVIDWEYGGMNDGYYDLACVCVENPLDEKCEETFLRAYCGGEPSEEARARLLISKFLVTSHWSTWSLVQICYGKDPEFYWEYGRTRAVQACSFLDDPKFPAYLKLIGG